MTYLVKIISRPSGENLGELIQHQTLLARRMSGANRTGDAPGGFCPKYAPVKGVRLVGSGASGTGVWVGGSAAGGTSVSVGGSDVKVAVGNIGVCVEEGGDGASVPMGGIGLAEGSAWPQPAVRPRIVVTTTSIRQRLSMCSLFTGHSFLKAQTKLFSHPGRFALPGGRSTVQSAPRQTTNTSSPPPMYHVRSPIRLTAGPRIARLSG